MSMQESRSSKDRILKSGAYAVANCMDDWVNVPGQRTRIERILQLASAESRGENVAAALQKEIQEMQAARAKFEQDTAAAHTRVKKDTEMTYGLLKIVVTKKHSNGRVTIQLPNGSSKVVNVTALKPVPAKEKRRRTS